MHEEVRVFTVQQCSRGGEAKLKANFPHSGGSTCAKYYVIILVTPPYCGENWL